MSKFLLNLPLHISKALLNSKIQFLIQKSFFLAFGPANHAAHSASGPPSPPAAPSPAGQNHPGRPIQPARRSRLRGKYVFLFDSRLPEPAASPRLSVNWAPPVRCVFPTAPTDLGRFLLSPPATPRCLTSDLVMPGKTITPRLNSPP
jgi:hypothetical protein